MPHHPGCDMGEIYFFSIIFLFRLPRWLRIYRFWDEEGCKKDDSTFFFAPLFHPSLGPGCGRWRRGKRTGAVGLVFGVDFDCGFPPLQCLSVIYWCVDGSKITTWYTHTIFLPHTNISYILISISDYPIHPHYAQGCGGSLWGGPMGMRVWLVEEEWRNGSARRVPRTWSIYRRLLCLMLSCKGKYSDDGKLLHTLRR